MKLQETLEHLNFSRLEAQIYMALIGSEPMSAYQLAKKIAIARPSIYNALEHMLDKGMVELVPDQTALYAAQEPEVLLGRMQAEMTANLSLARQQLEEYETAKQPEVHFVFRGFETAMARAGKLLEDAREEVYLNADFDLSCFAETFHRLKEKGVRIVAFSFYDLGLNREDVEFYTHGGMLTAHQPSRLMLVTDRQMTLTADCGAFANWSGTVSNNGLMVKILSEHIQHDITLLQLQEKYAAATDIPNLKIKYNNLIGYFVEVPAKFATRMLENKDFIHRQSVLNAVRFTTVELTEIENEIRGAGEKLLATELELFNKLVTEVRIAADDISRTAKALAELDVGAALADLAAEKNYCRPEIDDSFCFDVEDGRHPVVEASLAREHGGAFVGNDCRLGGDYSNIWLITGPNMAGKSTFLRQNAIIAVMAQIGSFVPAKRARIGVVNKLFSRVGASDDLARGRSTFMVEMSDFTSEMIQELSDSMRDIMDEMGMDELSDTMLSVKKDIDPADLKMMKIKHRNKEMKEIVKADAEYLKAVFGRLEKMKDNPVIPSGGGMSLSAGSSGTFFSADAAGIGVPTVPAPVIDISL